MNSKFIISMVIIAILSITQCTIAKHEIFKIQYGDSNISMRIIFDEPSIKEISIRNITFYEISIDNLENFENTGQPSLPYMSLRIALPMNSRVKKIIVNDGYKKIFGEYLIKPGDMKIPTSVDTSLKISKNESQNDSFIDEKVYNSDVFYPDVSYRLMSDGNFRGKKIITIQLYPIKYIPKQMKVYYSSEMIVTIETEIDENENQLYRGYENDKDLVKCFVDNPIVIDTYSSTVGKENNTNKWEYIIIQNFCSF